jgi:hypothetical protein
MGVLGGGGGRGRWSSGRPVSVCDEGWTTMVSVYKSSSQSIATIRRVGMTVGLHPSPTAPKADIKTFPSPPHYRKNRRLYIGTCFQKFPKLSGTKVQNVRIGFLGFLMSGKGINTRTDNLRVHTAGFDTRTTSVETTARSRWLEWRNHGCPKVKGTCRNPTLAKCGGEAQHLEKLEVGSLSGLPNVQSSTARGKTPRIGVCLVSLERSWNVDIENALALAIRTSATQVMGKRRAGSQTGSLTPDH